MPTTTRRNSSEADAAEACQAIAREIDALAWDADLLRLIREGECANDVLALVRHRAKTRRTGGRRNVDRMRAITAGLSVLKRSIERFEVNANEEEILRLARLAGCTAEMRDLAAVHVSKRRHAAEHAEREPAGKNAATSG